MFNNKNNKKIITTLCLVALSSSGFAETDIEKITRLETEKIKVTKELEEYKQISDNYGKELKKSHDAYTNYAKEVDNYIITKLNESIVSHDSKTKENVDRLSALDENIKKTDDMQKDIGTIDHNIKTISAEKDKIQNTYMKEKTENTNKLTEKIKELEELRNKSVAELTNLDKEGKQKLLEIEMKHKKTIGELIEGFKKNDEAVRLDFELENTKLQQVINAMKKAEAEKIKELTDKINALQKTIKILKGHK